MSSQLKGSSLSGQRRLTLESLESRRNPSTVIHEGDTLIIIGTQDDDTVAIVDDGQGGLDVTFDNTANGGGNGGGLRVGSGSAAAVRTAAIREAAARTAATRTATTTTATTAER